MVIFSLARTWAALVSLVCVLIVGLSVAAHAQTAVNPAVQFIDCIGKRAIAILSNQALDDSAKDAELRVLFQQSVDLDWIGRFVLGKYWRQASAQQQQQYLNGYRVFVVKSYTSRFREYTGSESYKILDSKPDGAGKFLVTMEIVRPGQPAVLIDYKLRQEAGAMKIYDIVVEGVSLLTTQRSEFGSVVSRKGLDYLIQQLEARART